MKCACLAALAAAGLLLAGCASSSRTWPPPEMTMESQDSGYSSSKPREAYAGRNRLMPLHETPYQTWYPRGRDPYY